MKFQVSRQDIQDAVEVTAGAMTMSAPDIAGHFVFRVDPNDKDQIEILTHSNRLCASTPVRGAKVLEDGTPFTVEGWRLKGMLQTLASDAVLILSMTDTDVKVEVQGYADITFRSLNHTEFPYWDKGFKDAKSVGKVQAVRLATALKQARGFASMDENTLPEAVVVNVSKGVMSATDKKSVMSYFTIKGLEQSGFRIHAKDIGTIVSFLDTVEDTVEILETDRKVYFKRLSDGTILGETRSQVDVPALAPPPENDLYTWTVKTVDLRKALKFVYFGASKKDDRLYLSHPEEDGPVKVSMKGESGKLTSVSVPCSAATKVPGAANLPVDGFPISMEHAEILLDLLASNESVTLGVNVLPEKKRRYVRVLNTLYADDKGEGGDQYLFVLAGSVW